MAQRIALSFPKRMVVGSSPSEEARDRRFLRQVGIESLRGLSERDKRTPKKLIPTQRTRSHLVMTTV